LNIDNPIRFPKLDHFTIDRKTWHHGKNGSCGSSLVVGPVCDNSIEAKHHGNMCCLGHYCLAAGVDKKTMTDIGFPDSLAHNYGIVMEGLVIEHTTVERDSFAVINEPGISRLADINDATMCEDREAKIIEGFAKLGIKAEFIN
jgi:hypothetical protein